MPRELFGRILERISRLRPPDPVLRLGAMRAAGDELRVGSHRYAFVGSNAGTTSLVTASISVVELH